MSHDVIDMIFVIIQPCTLEEVQVEQPVFDNARDKPSPGQIYRVPDLVTLAS